MRVSIKAKFILETVAIILILGLSTSVFIYTNLSQRLETELKGSALFLASHLRNMIVDDMLTKNHFRLKMTATDFRNSERDIEYIIIIDQKDRIIVHTFGDVFPRDLIDIHKTSPDSEHNIETLIADGETIYDIAVPILGGTSGHLRIGFSAMHIKGIVDETVKDVIAIILVVMLAGLLVAVIIGNRISRPVIELKELAEAFGNGELDRRAVVNSSDEVGHLACSFNAMAEGLKRTQEDLRDANTKLESYSKDLENEVIMQTADLHSTNKRLEKKISEQKEAERIIKDKEYWLTESQRAAQIGTYKLDVPTGNWVCTEVLDEIFGIDRSYEKTLEGWGRIIHPEHREMMEEYLKKIFSEKIPFDKEYMIVRISDSNERWLHGKGELILGEDGEPLRMIGTIHDITERKLAQDRIKESLAEKKVLLKEIHHRVKNNLTVVSSLLNMQSTYVDDAKYLEMFRESQNRIRSMSLVHEKLYLTEDFSRINVRDYIISLKESIKASFVGHLNIMEIIDVDDISMNIDTLIYCGLIINEILTNSFKYGSNGAGPLEIGLSLKILDSDSALLTVSDNGKGLPEDFDMARPKGIGFKLINALVSQIEGTYDINNDNGLQFNITFPV